MFKKSLLKILTASLIHIGSSMAIFNLFSSDSNLKAGSKAPDFSLVDQDNKNHNLSDYKGSFVILYFYPSDDTPGCTKEACSLRNSFDEFKKKNIKILGVSYDSPQEHKKFKQKYNLPFDLLSDTTKEVAKLYETKRWLLPYPKRKTFIISPDGIIVKILDNVDVNTHTEEILKEINQHISFNQKPIQKK